MLRGVEASEHGDEWFSAPPARPLTGDERFTGCEASVSEFWRFAMSDLR